MISEVGLMCSTKHKEIKHLYVARKKTPFRLCDDVMTPFQFRRIMPSAVLVKPKAGGLTHSHSGIIHDNVTHACYRSSDCPLVEVDMVRRSAGFVSKKPHRKSRGGCQTCKRKKVKVRLTTSYTCRFHVITSASAMRPDLHAGTALYDDSTANTLRTLCRQDHLHQARMHLLTMTHISSHPSRPKKSTSTTLPAKSQAGSRQQSMQLPAN